jgi:hypothetical protein
MKLIRHLYQCDITGKLGSTTMTIEIEGYWYKGTIIEILKEVKK